MPKSPQLLKVAVLKKFLAQKQWNFLWELGFEPANLMC